jgi:hypothetical protein
MSASSEADEDARAIVLNKETWTQRRRFVKEIYLRKLIAAAIREDMVDTLLVITDAMDTGWNSVVNTENHAALLVGAQRSNQFRMALARYCACIDSPSSLELATRLSADPTEKSAPC